MPDLEQLGSRVSKSSSDCKYWSWIAEWTNYKVSEGGGEKNPISPRCQPWAWHSWNLVGESTRESGFSSSVTLSLACQLSLPVKAEKIGKMGMTSWWDSYMRHVISVALGVWGCPFFHTDSTQSFNMLSKMELTNLGNGGCSICWGESSVDISSPPRNVILLLIQVQFTLARRRKWEKGPNQQLLSKLMPFP